MLQRTKYIAHARGGTDAKATEDRVGSGASAITCRFDAATQTSLTGSITPADFSWTRGTQTMAR